MSHKLNVSWNSIFSLVNMLHTTQTDHQAIWKIVRETRRKIVLPNNTCGWMESNKQFFIDQLIDHNINEVGKQLENNEVDDFLNDIKDSTFKTANEMFMYLNFCPDKDFHSLFSFYSKILKQSSTQIIVSWANILKETSQKTISSVEKLIAEELIDLQNTNMINVLTQKESTNVISKSMFEDCISDCEENFRILGIDNS